MVDTVTKIIAVLIFFGVLPLVAILKKTKGAKAGKPQQ